MSLTSWFLVSSGGTRHRLPREMIFVGRDDCELMLQMAKVCKVLQIRSRSVDKQHAVINYNSTEDEHKVKDLGSLNGTFVNETRIPEQTYITLKIDDKLRFGYDTNLFTVVRGELRVPEEALKHEKFTSQLQLPQKPPEAEESKEMMDGSVEARADMIVSTVDLHKAAVDTTSVPVARGTPLYGQPAWWGEDDADDENSSKQESKPVSVKAESSATGDRNPSTNAKEVIKTEDSKNLQDEVIYPFCREPSYFEIPTKEFHQSVPSVETSIHEIPTKDTEASRAIVQGHASFTIEFDDHTPGKVTIKDHVTKFTPEQRQKLRKSPPAMKELSGLQAAMIAAESKVADWLAQNDPPRMRRDSVDEDSKSIKSDLTIQMRRLKGNKHDDGTQSDTENGNGQMRAHKHAALEDQLRMYRAEQQRLHLQKTTTSEKAHDVSSMSRTAFMIEFFDEDNPRKRRSYSFTQIAAAVPQEGPHPYPPAKPDRSKAGMAESKLASLPHQLSPSHAKSSHVMHDVHQTRHLQKQKSDESSVPLVTAQVPLQRSSGSTGQRLSQSQMEQQTKISPSASKEIDDDQSDKGTYTIELETSNAEEEEARRMIDTVFGVVESPSYTGCGITRPVIAEQKTKWKHNTAEQETGARNGELSKELLNDSEIHPEGSFVPTSPKWVSQWANLAANDVAAPTSVGQDQDQETYSSRSQGRTSFTSTDELLHSKLEGNKLSKTKTTAVGSAGKSTTLPKPRPTRASILRRARLGDVSDNELADADKVSVVSEVSTTSSTTSKPPTGRKAPSRLDLLAQPRRSRLGSISARSDSEATITRSSVGRSGDSSTRGNLRGTSLADSKVPPRLRANSISRMPDSSRGKVSAMGPGSPSVLLQGPRWRRFPTDYASTSEDEFGSNRSSPKHSRLRTSTALRSAKLQSSNVTQSTNMLLKNKMKEQDDYIRDWTAHSEEIARYLSISKISQDLAKDLAILAREIHDVAGEIDSVSSSGTAPSTTVSTAATTPGSTIDTREEVGDLHGGMPKLVDRVFDESLNFRKIPPVPSIRAAAGNGRLSETRSRILEAAEQVATKRKTWNRDEIVLDSLMLTSVSQLSQKIRHAMEKTALKIRILFKNEERNWEEIESKMRSDSEVPILKTSNKEISLILQELKRVEKQLQAINVMIDPDGALDSACGLKITSPSLPGQPKLKSSPTHHSRITASDSDYSNHLSQYKHNGEDKDNSLHE
ncbi:centrosomal protein of 170 kDa isoform X8 [Mobula birostris]|uniref:centrosomal protein of 170 kDa isoform X8 n=1 Tax=Mobula birostris TaxID=1983395 RepID=UPI003B2883E1